MGDRKSTLHTQFEDPNCRLVGIAVLDGAGKVIQAASWGEDRAAGHYEHAYAQPLPQEAQVRIRVATPKAVVRAPVVLKDVPLP